MFDTLAPTLADDQAQVVDRVRKLATRIQNTRLRNYDPGAAFDPERAILLAVCKDPNSHEHWDAVQEHLIDYEIRATEFSERHVQQLRQAQIEGQRALSSTQAFVSSQVNEKGELSEEARQIAAAMSSTHDELTGAMLESLMAWRGLNDMASLELERVLPVRMGQLIRSAYLEAAFPNIYPDPFSPLELVEPVGQLTSLSDDQRVQIGVLIDEYKVNQRAVSQDMEREHLPVWFGMPAGKVFKPSPEYDAYKGRMDSLQEKRRMLAAGLLEAVTPMVPAEQSAGFAASLKAWKTRAEAHRSDDLTVLYRP